MATKAIIITDEQVEKLETWLNKLDAMSEVFFDLAQEAREAGNHDVEEDFMKKVRRADERQLAILKTLDILGFSWNHAKNEDGTETLHLILP